jgi:putative nucleotidyltransferase with HDIG domain
MMHLTWAPTTAFILVVDDDEPVLDSVESVLDQFGYRCQKARTVEEAIPILQQQQVHIALLDISMPGRSGLELIEFINTHCLDTGIIMLSGLKTLSSIIESLRGGADDYLVKPATSDELMASIERVIERRRAMSERRRYAQELEHSVSERTSELQDALAQIEETYQQTLQTLGAALDTRDVATQSHSERVTQYALAIGRMMEMPHGDLITLKRGVYLHDIGKIGIPDRILLKPDTLTPEEYTIMKTHPHLGMQLISRIEFLKDAADIVHSHHERFDGTGYPRHLKGHQIVLGARIFGVVDTLDAMTSTRPYREALSFDTAREEIARCSGTQFDPTVVEAFFAVPKDRWIQIRDDLAETAKHESLPQGH